MESVRSSFHAQLVTVMDSLLSAAVCEIAKIFERSLCEQQAQLVQKAEEISILRGFLEKEERRKKSKGGEEEQAGGDSRCRGQSPEKDGPSHVEPKELLTRLKEECSSEALHCDVSAVKEEKHEFAASPLTMIAVTVQTSREHPPTGDKSGTQAKSKLPVWDQRDHHADSRPLHDQASTPFQLVAVSGPASLSHPGEWVPGLDPAPGRSSSLDNMHTEITPCSGSDPPYFPAGFTSGDRNKEDPACPSLDRKHENRDSNERSVQEQSVGEKGAQHEEAAARSDETLWSHRDDTGGREHGDAIRRALHFDARDSLRAQPQAFTHPEANALNHFPSSSAGKGRPYACPYCNKCFTFPSHQRRHLLRHTGLRPHPCQLCEKSFLTSSELTVHIRTHTGERPFGCAQCGKRFGRSGNLKAHQRDVHMGRRPYTCTECGKKFAHRGNLRVHNHRVHQGDPCFMDERPEPDVVPPPIGKD